MSKNNLYSYCQENFVNRQFMICGLSQSNKDAFLKAGIR